MMYGYGVNGADGWWMVATMVIVALAILGSVWLVVHRPGAALCWPLATSINCIATACTWAFARIAD